MTGPIGQRLSQLGIDLPVPAKAVANYLTVTQTGQLIFTSGQLPLQDGKLLTIGLLGREVDVETGRLAARCCAANVLSQVRAAIGDLAKITRLNKITVFVASAPGFTEQHLVANGASDFFVDVLGDPGRHARSAVGVAALPMNAPVEVEAILEIE